MRYSSMHIQFGPSVTPPIIRAIILLTLIVTGFSAVTQTLFTYFLEMRGPFDWFSLSWWGIREYFIWQPATYLFTYYMGPDGISFSYLMDIAFHMLLLWTFGSSVCERIGARAFAIFYLLAGICSGICSILLMPLIGQYGIISGQGSAVLALMVLWTLMHPKSDLFLFFLIPVPAKWLTLGLVGLMTLSSLSQADFVRFFLYLSAVLIAYGYGALMLGVRNPFAKERKKATIVPFEQPSVSDDLFIDQMLEKISKHGERSLTNAERERMRRISERKNRLPGNH